MSEMIDSTQQCNYLVPYDRGEERSVLMILWVSFPFHIPKARNKYGRLEKIKSREN